MPTSFKSLFERIVNFVDTESVKSRTCHAVGYAQTHILCSDRLEARNPFVTDALQGRCFGYGVPCLAVGRPVHGPACGTMAQINHFSGHQAVESGRARKCEHNFAGVHAVASCIICGGVVVYEVTGIETASAVVGGAHFAPFEKIIAESGVETLAQSHCPNRSDEADRGGRAED